MDVHIGQLIKEVIEKKNLIKERVAESIGRQGPALHKILSKKDISTDIIKQLSEAIDHDLFMEIAKAQSIKKPILQDTLTPIVKDNYKEKYYSTIERYSNVMEKYSELQEKYASVLEENKRTPFNMPELKETI